MGMDPLQNHLFEVGVVHAALSCFRGPPPRNSCLVALQLGDGMGVLPGSWKPSVRGDVLGEVVLPASRVVCVNLDSASFR